MIEWTEADKAMVAQIAGEVTERIMISHMRHCPWGKMYVMDKKFLVGILIGAGLLGGTGAVAVLNHFIGGWVSPFG
jgi:hypothetical protein